jgi:hypothetical protein
MIQPRKLSEREPIMFILIFILMVVFLMGGIARRQAYDAEQTHPTQTKLKAFDASKNDPLVPATATNE